MASVTNEIIADLAQTLRPKLNVKARSRIERAIEAERACGDRQLASDIEFLLRYHDKAHRALGDA